MNNHTVTTKFISSTCGASGHRDFIAECSCGWKVIASHGTLSSLEPQILGHRISIIEKELNIKFEWKHV